MTRILSTYLFVKRKLTPALVADIAASGVNAVELFCGRSHFDYRSSDVVKELASALTDHNLAVHAVHAPADVICGAFNSKTFRDSGDPGWQSWDPANRAWTWRGSSDELLPITPIEVERYDGPLFLSHGTMDTVWSVEMTRRLKDRLEQHGRAPEVHFYDDGPHGLNSEDENRQHERLIDFFARHLA